MAAVDALRTRRSFARLQKTVDVPNLIDIQRRSFAWLTDPQNGGLRETIDDISPIEDYTGNLAVAVRRVHVRRARRRSLEQCREKDLTYARPLTVTVAFINRETGEIREQSVFMGDFPVDDRARHVRHQRHRARGRHAAGALARRLPDGAEGPREAGLHRQPDARRAARGSSSRSTRRARSTCASTASASCRSRCCCGRWATPRDEEILRLFDELALHPQHDRARHRGHAHRRGRADRAVQEAAPRRAAERRQRQGAAQPAVLRPQALRPHARRALQAQLASAACDVRHRHAHAHPRRHPRARPRARLAAQAPRRARGRRGRDQGLRRRGHRACRASPSPSTSTSTSTSATAACAPSAS